MQKILLFLIFSFLIETGSSQSIIDLRKYFNYNASQDFDFKILNTTDTIKAIIYDVNYLSANGLRVTAFLVVPKRKQAQCPAVIFVHGGEQNKYTFLSEALDLAAESFVSLVIDAPPARLAPNRLNYFNYSDPKKEFSAYRQTVIDVRRGIDLLEQNPLIDRYRIAFVGLDKGSWIGGILAGVENRIPFYILMGCSPCPTCDLKASEEPSLVKARSSLTQEQISMYEIQMRYLNPLNYLGNRSDSQIFFQFTDNDPYVSEEMAELAFKTSNEPKLEKYYSTTHFELLDFPEAKLDRKNWLKKQMK
jgi:hypothetical protein